jgi:mycothiol synthase
VSGRYVLKMARPLDQTIPTPQFPPGFSLRYGTGDDVVRWVEMFNEAFSVLPNYYPETVAGQRQRLAGPHYRAEYDLIGVAPDGTFAGFCYCRIDPEANARLGHHEGRIGPLGTRPGFRRLGLGRALLLTGLQQLEAAGMDTAILSVDPANPTGARRLYQSVGFIIVEMKRDSSTPP